MQWEVLDRNTKAIGFYECIGGTVEKEWLTVRMYHPELGRLAAGKVSTNNNTPSKSHCASHKPPLLVQQWNLKRVYLLIAITNYLKVQAHVKTKCKKYCTYLSLWSILEVERALTTIEVAKETVTTLMPNINSIFMVPKQHCMP